MRIGRGFVQTFPPAGKFDFAYPGVLEGNLTDCTWVANTECVSPLSGSDCFKIECERIDVACPPAGQDVCPDFTNTSCGTIPGTTTKYWMHKCNPLATPKREKVTLVACCLLYTSPSPRDRTRSRMPSSA